MVFVYEFLYRGGPKTEPGDDTWHVILGREDEDILGNKTVSLTTALTPGRAAELGYDLPTILAEVNQRAVDAIVDVATELRALQSSFELRVAAETATVREAAAKSVEKAKALAAEAAAMASAAAASASAEVAKMTQIVAAAEKRRDEAVSEAEKARTDYIAKADKMADEVALIASLGPDARERYLARLLKLG